MKNLSYQDAGVNITAGNEVIKRIKNKIATTFTPYVLSNIGSFAALIDLKQILQEYQEPVLVQSIDGVGTKTIIARMMNKYDTLGIDLLSASCNDILVTGAKPLTLLDYIATDKLGPTVIEDIVTGMVQACRDNDVALVGGETAEMPDTYLSGEHDLVGIVTGVVEKSKIINGSNIQPGDKVLGFISSGLHTNGYSLARKLFFAETKFTVDSKLPELDKTLGETLLAPHINYTKPVQAILAKNIPIKGMAHITGGGLLENIPRVLPNNCSVEIYKDKWQQPAIFSIMQKIGKIHEQEMYRTFNMGIGFVLIVAANDVNKIINTVGARHAVPLREIGQVITGNKAINLC